MAVASPMAPGHTGQRYFAINHEGVVYQSLKPFSTNDECKLTSGVPVGKPLPGWKSSPAHSLPAKPSSPALGEMRAIGMLKTISTCEALFREGDKDGDGDLDYGTLPELIKAKLLARSSIDRTGYRFTVCPGSKAREFLWMAVAEPVKLGKTGNRYFATNHAGVIYYSDKPIPLDRVECKIPKGLKPLGR